MNYISPFNQNQEPYKNPDNRDKEAKWIISDDDFERPYCSECKCVAYEYVHFGYCPNCGAKMEND